MVWYDVRRGKQHLFHIKMRNASEIFTEWGHGVRFAS